MNHHFVLEQFEEFLAGGNVSTTHESPIPIWAGYIIEQNARILEILMTNIETQMLADIASLVDSNTKIVALNAAQVVQITDLQGQIAALKSQLAAGGTVTADDLAQLDAITGQIAATASTTSATAAASATAPTTTPVEPQAPITSVPADQAPATDPTATAPVVPVQQPITSDPTKVSGADAGATSDSTAPAAPSDGTVAPTAQ
jgi:hypothetical protein